MNDYTYNNIESSQKRGDHRPIRSLPESVKARRRQIKVEAKKLIPVTIHHRIFDKNIRITGNTIREWLNQPHCNYAEKNEMLLNIEDVIRESEYLGQKPDKHIRGVIAHIFKTNVDNVDSWIIVREFPDGNVLLHSISDSPKVTDGIIKNPKQ